MCYRVSFINEQKIISNLNANMTQGNLPTAIYIVSLGLARNIFCVAVLLL